MAVKVNPGEKPQAEKKWVVTTVAGNGKAGSLNGLAGLGIDAHGNIYVADINNNRIRKISFE